MAHLIVCPKCQKGLRSATPVPAGKRIKCPACQALFVTGGDAVNVAVQAKAPAPVVTKTSPLAPSGPRAGPKPLAKRTAPVVDVVEVVEDEPPRRRRENVDDGDERSRRRRPSDVDDEDDDRPRRRRDEDHDDEDDRPRRRRKKKSDSNLGLILGIAGAFVVLLILVITGFGWPGFFLSGGRGGGGAGAVAAAGPGAVAAAPGGAAQAVQEPNLLAFVPADANFVVGVRLAEVRQVPQFQQAWNGVEQQLGFAPQEVRDLLNSTETFLIVGNFDRADVQTMILVTAQPYDAARIKMNLGQPITVQGQTIYPDRAAMNAQPTLIAMPSPKTFVITKMPQDQFAQLLASAAQGRVAPDLTSQVALVQRSLYWAALRFDDSLKQKMQPVLQNIGPNTPAEVKTIATIAQRGKGLTAALDVADNQRLKLSVGVTCNDANDAAQLKNAVQSFWTVQGKQLVDLMNAAAPQIGKLMNEVSQSLTFEQRELTAALSLQINITTLQELGNAQQNPGFNLPFNPPGFNPAAPPGVPGKKKGPPNFPKKF